MAARPVAPLVVAALLLAGACAAHAGDLYQWKDAKGVTHYSDAPPPKGHYAARSVHDQADAAPAAPPDATKPAAIAERNRSNCDTATANLQLLGKGGNVGLDADHDGKPDAPLGAEESARQVKLAQDNIARFCTHKAAATAP